VRYSEGQGIPREPVVLRLDTALQNTVQSVNRTYLLPPVSTRYPKLGS